MYDLLTKWNVNLSKHKPILAHFTVFQVGFMIFSSTIWKKWNIFFLIKTDFYIANVSECKYIINESHTEVVVER